MAHFNSIFGLNHINSVPYFPFYLDFSASSNDNSPGHLGDLV